VDAREPRARDATTRRRRARAPRERGSHQYTRVFLAHLDFTYHVEVNFSSRVTTLHRPPLLTALPRRPHPRERLVASLCNSVVSASMSATSSFVGKAIAQKVSVKSTKASTTVRASAVNKVRVAHALDDARTTLSRADTRPPRECHPSAHRAHRPRPRTTTDRNGLFTPMRSTRALRATSRRVAHRSSSSRFPAIDRGSILRIDRGGSAIDRSNRWVTTMRGYRSKRAVDRAACTHFFHARTGCLLRRRDGRHRLHHRPSLRHGRHRAHGQATGEPNRSPIDLRGACVLGLFHET